MFITMCLDDFQCHSYGDEFLTWGVNIQLLQLCSRENHASRVNSGIAMSFVCFCDLLLLRPNLGFIFVQINIQLCVQKLHRGNRMISCRYLTEESLHVDSLCPALVPCNCGVEHRPWRTPSSGRGTSWRRKNEARHGVREVSMTLPQLPSLFTKVSWLTTSLTGSNWWADLWMFMVIIADYKWL